MSLLCFISSPLRCYKERRSRDWHSSEFVVTHISRDWIVVNSLVSLIIVRLRHGSAHVLRAILGGAPTELDRESVGNKNANVVAAHSTMSPFKAAFIRHTHPDYEEPRKASTKLRMEYVSCVCICVRKVSFALLIIYFQSDMHKYLSKI